MTAANSSPSRLVRWAFEVASPSRETGSQSSTSSSNLTFISSQLVAHGFVRPPGLVQPLSSLSQDDQDAVLKCLRDLLEQRITDMERTEELTTRLRTLSFDHERLLGMHKAANQDALLAHRETEIVKAKHATTTSTLCALQATHKQTTANLQRAQSALQFTRQTAQNEIKRKDAEVERIQQRWNKLINEQPKSGPAALSMRCSNLAAESGLVIPKGDSILESTLARLKADHDHLLLSNESLRTVMVSFASGLEALVSSRTQPSAPRFSRGITDLTLFPPSETAWKDDADNARAVLRGLLNAAEALMISQYGSAEPRPSSSVSEVATAAREKELQDRLGREIDTLKCELDETRKALTEQMNGALDAFVRDQRVLRGQPRESVESSNDLAVPDGELEKESLEEKERMTAAAIELGKERNAIAAARLELQEEKRAWRLQQMLDEMPETPVTTASAAVTRNSTIPAPSFEDQPAPHPRGRSPKKASSSARVSPTKKKGNPRRMLTTARNAFALEDARIVEEEEEEAEDSAPLLPKSSSFTNPFDQILAQSAEAAQSLNRLNISPERPHLQSSAVDGNGPVTTGVPSPESPTLPSEASLVTTPQTPISLSAAQARLRRNPYAPAVPSPLSRILRMADSPVGSPIDEASPSGSPVVGDRWTLARLVEDDESENGSSSVVPVPLITLSEELGLGLAEGSRHSPTKRAQDRKNRASSPRRHSAKEKGKEKLLGSASSRAATARGQENAAPPLFSPVMISEKAKDDVRPAINKKITIGHRVVGGRPTTSSPHLARLGVTKSGFPGSAAPRSLREQVRAKYADTVGLSIAPTKLSTAR